MTTYARIRLRGIVLFMIVILIFSTLPGLTAQQNFDSESTISANTSSSEMIFVPESEIDFWDDHIGFIDQAEFDLDEYNLKLTKELGPELVLKRTGNAKMYQGPNNEVTARFYAGDIHYKTPTGSWAEFNTKIQEYDAIPINSDMVYTYGCEDNTIRTYFKDGYGDEKAVLTVVGDDFITWEPEVMTYKNLIGFEDKISEPINTKAITKNNQIMYLGSYPNSMDIFTVTEHKLKHEIILSELPEFDIYMPESLSTVGTISLSEDFSLYLKDESIPIQTKITTDSALEIYNEHQNNYLRLLAPVAYELNNHLEQTTCEYTIEPLNGNYRISIDTPYTWLSDPKREYPVVIDPTIAGEQLFRNKPGESSSNDTWIGDNSGNLVDNNYGTDRYMLIGGQGFEYRALLKFDISGLPPNDILFSSATMWLTPEDRAGQQDFDSGDSESAVHELTEGWTEGTGTAASPTTDGTTWKTRDGTNAWSGGNGGTFNANEEDLRYVNTTEVPYDLQFLVTKWRNNPVTNKGVIVKYSTPGSYVNLYKAFYSSKEFSDSKRPRLDVIFTNDPPKKTTITKIQWYEDTDESTIIYLQPDIFVDPNNDDLTITIWNGTGWDDEFKCPIFNATLEGKGTISEPWICVIELNPNKNGDQEITFNATDRIAYTEADIIIEIIAINDPPILHKIGNQVATEEEWLYVDLEVTEVEGEKLTWDTNVSSYNSPNFMDNLYIQEDAKIREKAQLIFFPNNNDVPIVYVNVSVYDDSHTPPFKQSIDWEHIEIIVNNVNDDPKFTKVDDSPVYEKEILINAVQDKKKLIYVQAYDDDLINGDDLEFSTDAKIEDNFTVQPISGLDVPLEYRAINTEVGKIEFTPKNRHVGEFIVNISVEDTEKSKDDIRLKLKVSNVNDPPEIISHSISPPSSGTSHSNRDFINFSCIVDDPDLHIPDSTEKLNITWYSNISKLLGYGASVKNIRLKAGMHKITIEVTDLEGEKANKEIILKVEKSITLQKYCEQAYSDMSDFDDIEYSYNDKTRKFTVSQGRYEEVDLVNLSSYYQDGYLIIELLFSTDIELDQGDFNIKVFLVTEDHEEPNPDYYNVVYTSGFFQKGLYQPSDTYTYGQFNQDDGTISENMFSLRVSLADLEEGTDDFRSLQPNFKIFAIAKWYDIEYHKGYTVQNFRYDSIGWGSAYAPHPTKKDVKDDDEGLDANMMFSIIAVIIVIILIIIVALFMKRKKKKEEKTVIDFSKPGAGRVPGPQKPQDVQQMFMSPFEQQFGVQPGMAPGLPGSSPMMPQQRPPQQMPLQQPPRQMSPGLGTAGGPKPGPTPTPGPTPSPTPTQPKPIGRAPGQAPTQQKPGQMPQKK